MRDGLMGGWPGGSCEIGVFMFLLLDSSLGTAKVAALDADVAGVQNAVRASDSCLIRIWFGGINFDRWRKPERDGGASYKQF